MKRKPMAPANQARMDGGPVQLSMLSEWADHSEQPDPVAQEQERLARRPLPGQAPLIDTTDPRWNHNQAMRDITAGLKQLMEQE